MVPVMVGIYPLSCISHTANAHVSEEEYPRIGKRYTIMEDQVIRRGQRMDLLNIRNDARRAKVQKMIVDSQTSLERHGYKVVNPDPRFENNHESVPFPTFAASRPILVDDIEYRTTFLS